MRFPAVLRVRGIVFLLLMLSCRVSADFEIVPLEVCYVPTPTASGIPLGMMHDGRLMTQEGNSPVVWGARTPASNSPNKALGVPFPFNRLQGMMAMQPMMNVMRTSNNDAQEREIFHEKGDMTAYSAKGINMYPIQYMQIPVLAYEPSTYSPSTSYQDPHQFSQELGKSDAGSEQEEARVPEPGLSLNKLIDHIPHHSALHSVAQLATEHEVTHQIKEITKHLPIGVEKSRPAISNVTQEERADIESLIGRKMLCARRRLTPKPKPQPPIISNSGAPNSSPGQGVFAGDF